jgi:hypothetical protein
MGIRHFSTRGYALSIDMPQALRQNYVTSPPLALASRSLQEPRPLLWGTQTHVPPFIPEQAG